MMQFVFDRYYIFWEKEKVLISSILSFSHNVFKKLLSRDPYTWEMVKGQHDIWSIDLLL